jgi:hypothetical protein
MAASSANPPMTPPTIGPTGVDNFGAFEVVTRPVAMGVIGLVVGDAVGAGVLKLVEEELDEDVVDVVPLELEDEDAGETVVKARPICPE